MIPIFPGRLIAEYAKLKQENIVQIFQTSGADRDKRLAEIEKLRKDIGFEGHTTDFDLMLLNNRNVSIVMKDEDFERTYKLFQETYWKGLLFSAYFAEKTGVLRNPHGV